MAQMPAEDMLPEGPAKAWVLTHCTACHDLTPISEARQPAEEWHATITRMIGNTASEAEIAAAATYLAAAYPEAGRVRRRAIETNREIAVRPVTAADLRDPDPGDWLMYSRTYDAQRFSPLDEIDSENVADLSLAWSRGLGEGVTESIPIVRDGTIFMIVPGAGVMALDGATGDFLWEYRREVGARAATARAKTLAIYGDLILYSAPDGYLVGLEAGTGKVRWETFVGYGNQTSGTFVADGTVISGRSCQAAEDCFIAAHDAVTGEEKWRFQIVPPAGDPAAATWGEVDTRRMTASSWGLPGSYDPDRRILYWGTANPGPYTRLQRNGDPRATGEVAPVALYSNSTLALDLESGALSWHYQHLPGDDWDSDYTNERTLVTTTFDPDPAYVKWINPDVARGSRRDMVVTVGEPGGLFALDRADGTFLWATPFPYDVPNFLLSDIDTKTGLTRINSDLVFEKEGDRSLICFFNTRSFWPTGYSPLTNSLYVPYVDNCLDMTAGGPRFGVPRPGIDLEKFAGIAKIDLTTGAILRFGERRAPDNGAILVTSGNLVFHGDLNRRFKAYDAGTGERLWETILPGPISVSTITYQAGGRQYVLVMTGDTVLGAQLAQEVGQPVVSGQNAVFAFALPEQRTTNVGTR